MNRGIGGHQTLRVENPEWLTPRWVVEKLGPFDLDPCYSEPRPWQTARVMIGLPEDGYGCEWRGFVWLNPPYGKKAELWIRKLAEHGSGIALLFARTETRTFFPWVWEYASSILFLKGRITFCDHEGKSGRSNSGAPSCLVGYGKIADSRLKAISDIGRFIKLK